MERSDGEPQVCLKSQLVNIETSLLSLTLQNANGRTGQLARPSRVIKLETCWHNLLVHSHTLGVSGVRHSSLFFSGWNDSPILFHA